MGAAAFILCIELSKFIFDAFVVVATSSPYELGINSIVHDGDSRKIFQEKRYFPYEEVPHCYHCVSNEEYMFEEAFKNDFMPLPSPAGEAAALKKNTNRSLIEKYNFKPVSKNTLLCNMKSPTTAEDRKYSSPTRYGSFPSDYGFLKSIPSVSSLIPIPYNGGHINTCMPVVSYRIYEPTPFAEQEYRKGQTKLRVDAAASAATLDRHADIAWSELIHDTIMPNILPTMLIPFSRQRGYGTSRYNRPVFAAYAKKFGEYAVPPLLETWPPAITDGRNPGVHDYSYEYDYGHRKMHSNR